MRFIPVQILLESAQLLDFVLCALTFKCSVKIQEMCVT